MGDFEQRLIECPVCGREVPRADADFTKDCYGITFRLVCIECYKDIMYGERGYDGEKYDALDECIDYDY